MNQMSLLHLITCKVTVSRKERANSLLQVFVRATFGSALWYFLPHFIAHNQPRYPNLMQGTWNSVGPARRHKVGLGVSATGDLLTPLRSPYLSSQLPVFSPLNQCPAKERKLSSERERKQLNESTSLHTKSKSIKFQNGIIFQCYRFQVILHIIS